MDRSLGCDRAWRFAMAVMDGVKQKGSKRVSHRVTGPRVFRNYMYDRTAVAVRYPDSYNSSRRPRRALRAK